MLEAGDFDLVLLDILTPEMDGYEVPARLKGNLARRDLPVIVISALDEMQSVTCCIGIGAEDYLPKPFDPEATSFGTIPPGGFDHSAARVAHDQFQRSLAG
jgi:CheY-like chemotaxis protein